MQLALSMVIVILYVALDRFSSPKLAEGAEVSGFKEQSARKAVGIARSVSGLFGLLFIGLIWGIEISSVLVFAGTAVTLLGVAFFASWSLLSNVTAYFILLLHPSFRKGTYIRVIDGDNYAEGSIAEISVFSTKLVSESQLVILYPNNLLLGRPTLIGPRDRLNSVGKLPPNTIPDTQEP